MGRKANLHLLMDRVNCVNCVYWGDFLLPPPAQTIQRLLLFSPRRPALSPKTICEQKVVSPRSHSLRLFHLPRRVAMLLTNKHNTYTWNMVRLITGAGESISSRSQCRKQRLQQKKKHSAAPSAEVVKNMANLCRDIHSISLYSPHAQISWEFDCEMEKMHRQVYSQMVYDLEIQTT